MVTAILPLIGEESKAWMDRGMCTTVSDPEIFFPKKGDSQGAIRRAKLFCDPCPVKRECLEDALAWEATPGWMGRHGIRGGLTAMEREKLVKEAAA